MSKEYIERDSLIAWIDNLDIDWITRGYLIKDYLIKCLEDKNRFPAADVAPVRHGEWIEYGKDDNDITIVQCSICQIKRYGAPAYCSRCGARMDGGNKQ